MPPTSKTSVADNDDAASHRRLRKREQDRQCQRQLRERTRNRIAELEQMVESLSQRDSNGQVAELMAKLRSVTEERDQLRRKLRSVRTALGSHDIRLDGSTEEEPVTREEQNSPPIAASVEERRAESTSDLATGFVDAAGETSTQKLALSPSLIFSSNPTPGHQNMPVLQPLEGDYAFSAPTVTCECSRQSEPFVQRQPLWQFANQTLSQNEALPTQTYQLEESLSDDMPIRALIQGWDVVENQLGAIATPSWKKLRFIDEILFRNCGFPERLAIMRMMYLQHRYSTNPSPHNQKSLPSWYLKRPCQDITHSCAIDYFVWPGIRERFIFHEHRYCSNRFWELFSVGFHLLWPFEFRDCYSYNTETNLYSLSHAFSERIADLNAWTMDTCFFDPWPEFKSDIPVFNSIPASMPAKAGALITANRSHQEAIQETIQETEWSAIDPVTTLLHWNVSDSMTVEA